MSDPSTTSLNDASLLAAAKPPPEDGDGAVMIRQRQLRHDLGILRLWAGEIASLVVAAALVAAMVAVLYRYDGQPLPKWPYSINLNTIIALLTLCLRAALVLVAAEVISQSKWIWFFDRTRPLANFQTFDEASRGLIGSFKLISLLRLSFRGSPLAVAAAVTTIISLAISPFSQQAIKTVPCTRLVPDGGARVPVAMALPGADGSYRYGNEGGNYRLGSRAQGAILSGITNPHGNDSALQPQCPTGNCTFPDTLGVSHSTMGLCAQCLDTTSLLRISWRLRHDGIVRPFNQTNTSLGDVTLSIMYLESMLIAKTHANLSFAESIMTPEFRDATQDACSNVSVMTYSRTPLPPRRGMYDGCGDGSYNPKCVVAATCTLYPCMKDISVRVIDGRLEDHVVKTTPARVIRGSPPTENHPGYYVVKSPCLVGGKLYDVTNFSLVPVEPRSRTFTKVPVQGREVDVPSDCLYTMLRDYNVALGRFMSENVFDGSCNDTMAEGRRNLVCSESWWLNQFYNGGSASFKSLNSVFQDMATATTNFFRADGWGPVHNETIYRQSNDSSLFKAFVGGNVYETTTCVRFEWPWLLLPAALCLTTVALLVGMLLVNARNSHRPVWKSSTLPLLFFGLDARQPGQPAFAGARAEDLRSLRRQARGTTVALDVDGDSSRTALVNIDEQGG